MQVNPHLRGAGERALGSLARGAQAAHGARVLADVLLILALELLRAYDVGLRTQDSRLKVKTQDAWRTARGLSPLLLFFPRFTVCMHDANHTVVLADNPGVLIMGKTEQPV